MKDTRDELPDDEDQDRADRHEVVVPRSRHVDPADPQAGKRFVILLQLSQAIPFAGLREDELQVFERFVFGTLTIAEIARELCMPRATVKDLLDAAYRRIAKVAKNIEGFRDLFGEWLD